MRKLVKWHVGRSGSWSQQWGRKRRKFFFKLCAVDIFVLFLFLRFEMAPFNNYLVIILPFSDHLSSFLYINVSSVVEFQRWWVLTSKFFGQESTYLLEGRKIIRQWMTAHQKLGMILENKVVQKLKFEKMFFTKNGLLNWYSEMNFFWFLI